MELESWKAEFEGKKVLIWGYGMEGKSSYASLCFRGNCDIYVVPMGQAQYD